MAKAWILSDLHLDVSAWTPDELPAAEIAIVAGDICEGLVKSVEWLARHVRPHMAVVAVAGNHEFYGSSHLEGLAEGRRAAAANDILLLENDTVEVAGIRVSGCTLWTDHRGADGNERRFANREAARVGMRDYGRIAWRRFPRWAPFRPEDAEALHAASLAFLDEALAAAPATAETPHAVVTHHAPSTRSIAPQFQGDALNGAFVSPLDDFVARTRPTLWVHGHTHASCDYRIQDTRVLCNARGYGRENAGFKPDLVVDITT